VTPPNTRRIIAVAVLVAVVAGGIGLWLAVGRGNSSPAVATSAPTSSVLARVTTSRAGTAGPATSITTPSRVSAPDGMATVRLADLPAEARHTVQLVLAGGPFPYARDGVVFENRERHLPAHASGYYHEYTVVTPGASTRGTRRIIVGHAGELYYTDDHYDSFTWVALS
jgi:ribonuclease T1